MKFSNLLTGMPPDALVLHASMNITVHAHFYMQGCGHVGKVHTCISPILHSLISIPFSARFAIENSTFGTNNFQACLHWWGTASSAKAHVPGYPSLASSKDGMSNGCPMDGHWTGGLDRTGQYKPGQWGWDVQSCIAPDSAHIRSEIVFPVLRCI